MSKRAFKRNLHKSHAEFVRWAEANGLNFLTHAEMQEKLKKQAKAKA